MPQPEAKFKKALTEAYAKAFPQGWCAYFPARQRQGAPDLYFTVSRRGVWVEAKVGNNPLSAIQKAVTNRMVRAGNVVFVARLMNPTAGLRSQIVEFTALHSQRAASTRWFRRDLGDPSVWERMAAV